MFSSGKDRAIGAWTNLRGWRTSRRIVVFESDDWGAAKIRNLSAAEAMINQGVSLDCTRYDRLDCLESQSDLQALFETLSEHRDAKGRPPIFTLNTIVANPDYDAIKASGFERYIYEDFAHSYRRYHGEDILPLWKSAMECFLIKPQFHGREHLNVGLWLHDLRDGHHVTRVAFENGFYGHTTKTSSSRQTNYLAAFWPESQSQFEEIKNVAADGLNLFEQLFGFRSRSFVACNYVLPDQLDATLAQHGIELIQGQRGQIQPSSDGATVSVRRAFTGQQNRHGQVYTVRNAKFEPFEDLSRDWVLTVLNEIRTAFFLRKPAVVSTHRVNYVGGLNLKHRDRNLDSLGMLLRQICRKWPDVEFLSSDELLNAMS